ncbi:helix-turn-helix domain-containing protein [Geodermatophilus sp. CPCC 206100]|uniref:helix-turn-helix domain-containing protein n=1 Tax=Geodermatophilus sp. CPCC 206100 TaxID=3020054 RepID=UPI003B002BBD
MQQTAGPRGTVIQAYLGESGPRTREASDAVLVRSTESRLTARAHSWQLGRIPGCDFRDCGDVVVTPLTYNRHFPAYYLGVLLDGEGLVSQRGADGTERTVPLGQGRMVLYSRSRPFRLQVRGPYHYLVLEVTPSVLGVGQDALAAATVSEDLASAPSAALVTGLLGQLPDQLGRMSAQLRLQAADAVTSLLAGHLQAPRTTRGPNEDLFERILLWIEHRLGDPGLSPDAIAAAHHISTRYLHKVFQQQALTVAGYVRARRLELVHRDLGDPARRAEPVSAVARRWGIPDPSHLSKAFRSRYGTSPREHRERAAVAALADDRPLPG